MKRLLLGIAFFAALVLLTDSAAAPASAAVLWNRTIFVAKGDSYLVDFWVLFNNFTTGVRKSSTDTAVNSEIFRPGDIVFVDKPETEPTGHLLPVNPKVTRASIRMMLKQRPSAFTYRQHRKNVYRKISMESSALGQGSGKSNLYVYRARNCWEQPSDSRAHQNYTDTFSFTINGGTQGVLNIRVFNTPPTVRPLSTVRGINSNFSTYIMVKDFDTEMCGPSEIKGVRILDTPSLTRNTCVISYWSGSGTGWQPIAVNLTLMASMDRSINQLRIKADNINIEEQCKFEYVALDRSDLVSNSVGVFQFQLGDNGGAVKRPVAVSQTRNYWPQKQKTLLLSLSVLDANEGKVQRSFDYFISQLPDYGKLYNVMKLKDDSVAEGKGSEKTSGRLDFRSLDLEKSSYKQAEITAENMKTALASATRMRRIYVLYAGPKFTGSTREDFLNFLNRNDTFQWNAVPNDDLSGGSKNATVTIRFRDPALDTVTSAPGAESKEPSNASPLHCGTKVYNRVFKDRSTRVRLNYTVPAGDEVVSVQVSSSMGAPVMWGALVEDTWSNVKNASIGEKLAFGRDKMIKKYGTRAPRRGATTEAPAPGASQSQSVQGGEKNEAMLSRDAEELADDAGGSSSAASDTTTKAPNILRRNTDAKNRRSTRRPLATGMYLRRVRWPRLRFYPNTTLIKEILAADPKQELTITYSFLISTKYGSRCSSTLKFVLMRHEPGKLDNETVYTTGKSDVPYVVYDTAPFGQYTLMALGGSVVRRDPAYTFVKVVSPPKYGMLYNVHRSFPIDLATNSAAAVDPVIDGYCTAHACERYKKGGALVAGNGIERWKAFSRGDNLIADSQARFWALYRQKFVFSNQTGRPESDSFTIQLCRNKEGNGCDENTMQYNLFLTEGKLRRIYFNYVPSPSVSNLGPGVTMVQMQLTKGLYIDDPLQEPAALPADGIGSAGAAPGAGKTRPTGRRNRIANPRDYAVLILDEDTERRHTADNSRSEQRRQFLLYDAVRNGGELVPVTKTPIRPVNGPYQPQASGRAPFGKWVQNFDNYIFFSPKAHSAYHNFRFRIRIFRVRDIANGDYNHPVEDVRVIAVRDNFVPVWFQPFPFTLRDSYVNATTGAMVEDTATIRRHPKTGYATLTPKLGQTVNFDLNGYDEDNDPLWYIVLQGPAHGELFFENIVGGDSGVGRHAVGSGYRFKVNRLASGAAKFSTAHVVYKPRFEAIRDPNLYPINDSLVLALDDGGGVTSNPLKIPIQIQWAKGPWLDVVTLSPRGDGQIKIAVDGKAYSSGGSAAVAKLLIVVLLVMAIALAVYFLRRRGQLRQRFQRLARGVENAIDEPSEMTAPPTQ